MRKFARWFSYVVAFVFKLCPKIVKMIAVEVLAFIWVDIFKIRKSVVYSNIDKALPNSTDLQKKTIYKKSIKALARSFFEVMEIPYLTDSWIDKNVIFHGLENIDPKKATLFLTLHIGSGDLGAAVVCHKLMPISLISKRLRNPFMDEFWFSLRGRSKTEFINAHGKQNAFEILKAIKKNHGVIFVLDQFMGKPYGVETEFFGHKTGTAYGLALFAAKTAKPVIPLYTYWGSDQKMHIIFKPAIDLSQFQNDNSEDKYQKMTQKFNAAIEDIIRSQPEQWMWVHKRWKDFE